MPDSKYEIEELTVIHDGLRALIKRVGDDPDREGLLDTPTRVWRAMLEQCNGYHQDPNEILKRTFKEKFDEMIVVKDIEFNSLCEHHLLPFTGLITIGYIPNGKVVGLSKLPRLVDCFAHRLQIQERLAMQIADAIETYLQTRGVGVIIEAFHQCLSCRGIKKQRAAMVTSVLRGDMRNDSKARAEFLSFLNQT